MNGLFGDIIFEPIIPIPVMAVFCVVLIIFKRRGITPYIRQILTVLLLFVINLRPMYPADNIRVESQKMDLNVIIVVDDTISMLGDDQDGYETRLDRAKADMYYLIENLPGSKFSIMCFNNNTHVLTPLTDSVDYLHNAVDSIYPLSPTYATGTNISICYDTLEDMVDEASEYQNTQTVVFFMTDGENTDGGTMRSFRGFEDEISGGAVLGYGTERGGHMNYYDSMHDRWELVTDYTHIPSTEAVTKLDESNLRSLADDLGIPYVYMNSENPLEPVVEAIREDYLADPEEQFRQGYKDIYYVFVAPLVLLVSYEFISLKRRG